MNHSRNFREDPESQREHRTLPKLQRQQYRRFAASSIELRGAAQPRCTHFFSPNVDCRKYRDYICSPLLLTWSPLRLKSASRPHPRGRRGSLAAGSLARSARPPRWPLSRLPPPSSPFASLRGRQGRGYIFLFPAGIGL